MVGININDKTQDFTGQILRGEKTVETRRTNSLRPYVGKRVGIVRTGRGRARADVGTGRFWGQRRRGHEVFPWVRISLFTNIMRALIENHAI